MVKNLEFRGAIFDVDDTLLDNFPADMEVGLHEFSRLTAVHEVGRRRGIEKLTQITPQQNTEAFRTAHVHTVEAALWNILRMADLVFSADFDPHHELVLEMAFLKNELHENVLRTRGKEVPGATQFVRSLAEADPQRKFAIASAAPRHDIDIFLEMMGLNDIFLAEHIFSKENVQHHKPHPEVFNLAFSSFGFSDEHRRTVLAFEDDPRGVTSAKAAGLFTCAITTRFSRAHFAQLDIAPDLIADSFEEFAGKLGLCWDTENASMHV